MSGALRAWNRDSPAPAGRSILQGSQLEFLIWSYFNFAQNKWSYRTLERSRRRKQQYVNTFSAVVEEGTWAHTLGEFVSARTP